MIMKGALASMIAERIVTMFDPVRNVYFDVPVTTVYETREKAEDILSALEEYLVRYESIPVAYLCELLRKPTCDSMEHYGWKDLRNVWVCHHSYGYMLELPEPVRLVEECRPDCFPHDETLDIASPSTVMMKQTGECVEGLAIGISKGSSYPALFAILCGYYPEKIIHNGPATIVFWPDRTKTIVKCSENDAYDAFDAFTAALAKKIYGGSTSAVKTMLKKVTVEQAPKKKKADIQ